MAVPNIFATATSAIPLSQLDANFSYFTNQITVTSAVGISISGTLGVTGATTLSSALTYGGVTLSNAVTGTGNMVLATSPTLTTPNIGAATGTSLNLGSGALTAGATGVTTLTASGLVTGNAGAVFNWAGGTGVTLNRTDGAGFLYLNKSNGVNGVFLGSGSAGEFTVYTGAANTLVANFSTTGLTITGTLSAITGATSTIVVGKMSGQNHGAISVNNDLGLTTMVGIAGGASGDANTCYVIAPTSVITRIGASGGITTVSSTGLDVTGTLGVTGTATSTTRLAVGNTGTSDALTSYTSTGGSLYMGLDNSAGTALGTAGAYGTAIYRPASTGFAISRAGTVDLSISSAGVVTIPGKTIVNAALDVNPAFGLGVYVSPATDANGTASVLRLYGGANQFTNRYVEISCYNNTGSNVNEMVFKVGNVGTILEAMKLAYTGAVTIPGTLGAGGTIITGAASAYALRATGNATGGYGALIENTNLTATSVVLDVWHYASTGDNAFINFFTEGSPTQRGSITYNRAGGLTAYNTTSDYRLKEQIIDLPNALETVSKLKPRQFDWKETGNTTTGFIAHELAEVCPHAVTGEKDATEIKKYEITPAVHATFDEEGKELTAAVEAVMGEREVPMYQGIDTSFLVATLTAAIQELNSKFEEYKSTHP